MTRLFDLADNRRAGSLANRFRRRRFELFKELVAPLPRPVRVLDVGGTENFWRQMNAADADWLEIVLVNVSSQPATAANVEAVVGDGRDLSPFSDGSFDVVFSNSVIEHVGGWEDQRSMADEMRRVGRLLFVQTPNRFFPIEPHFLFPGFQFLPVRARIALVRRFPLGYHDALPDPEDARRAVEEIRLLTASELRQLFPGARIHRERALGLTKSFVVCAERQ